MNYNYIVLAQIAVPLLFGLSVMAYLKSVTRRLLTDLCGSDDRAEFWVRITTVLVASTPLALVLLFGKLPSTCPADSNYFVGDAFRNTVGLSLVGILLAVGLVSRGIWRQIPRPLSMTAAQTKGSQI